MRRVPRIWTLAVLAAGHACAGGAGDSEQEMSVVDYASTTHGAIQVTSANPLTGDWFDVFQSGTRAITGNPPLLGSTVEVPRGTYQVSVNRTERTVTVEEGRQTILRTGELLVEGEPEGAMWYPVQDGDRKVVSNPPILNTQIALFAGRYEVIVWEGAGTGIDTAGVAEVLPARVNTFRR